MLAGAQRHVTIDRALRLLGLGAACIEVVPADDQGAHAARGLERALAGRRRRRSSALRRGEVNTGAFDPLTAIAEPSQAHGRVAARRRRVRPLGGGRRRRFAHLAAGVERADSWATDAHKWLNVPYDSGLAFCAHPDAHRAAMGVRAAYLIQRARRRSATRSTGRRSSRAAPAASPSTPRCARSAASGVAELVERCCAQARALRRAAAAEPGVEVLNDVVLNQVLVRFGDDGDARRAGDRRACRTTGPAG